MKNLALLAPLLAWSFASCFRSGAPGGRHAPKRPSSVARWYAGYSRAETRWSVARMIVVFTTSPRSIAPVSCSLLNPARRDHSATYGEGAHWP